MVKCRLIEYSFRSKKYNCVFHMVKCRQNRVDSTKEKLSVDQCFQLGEGAWKKMGLQGCVLFHA